MAMPVPTQYVLYTNDGMDVSYSDGSRLRVSPCGSSFQYHRAASDVHPALRNSRAENRSQFATQDVRPCLIDALDFRNRFAERPFLCKELLDPRQIIKLHADIQEIAWPRTMDQKILQRLKDGSTKLVSEDEYAVITLGTNRRHATVEYLAKVSQRLSRRSLEGIPQRGDDSTIISASRLNDGLRGNSSVLSSRPADFCDDQENSRWDYVWTVQYHSVQDCPDHWRAPLDLILKHLAETDASKISKDSCLNSCGDKDKDAAQPEASNRTKVSFMDNDYVSQTSQTANNSDGLQPTQHNRSLKNLLKKDFNGCLFTTVPKTLPLNCFAQHMHRWERDSLPNDSNEAAEAAYVLGQVKVICVQGVIYRLLWSSARGIEIFPGDGSVIVSQSLVGKFFSHYIAKNGKVVERTYSAESLPPTSPNFPYSVNKLVTRALRFLQLVQAENFQLMSHHDSICWKQQEKQFIHNLDQIPSTKLLEQNVVGGVGTFTAYTNGQIHIKFLDRTILDMTFDYDQKSIGSESIHAKLQSLRRTLNIKEGMCRLLLPSGQYQYVSVDDPGIHDKYVKAAVAWRKWVTTDEEDRQKEIEEKQDNSTRVYQELKKIQCFNFLLENSLLATFSPLVAAAQSKCDQLQSQAQYGSHMNDIGLTTDADVLCWKLRSSSPEDKSVINQDTIAEILKKTSAAVEDIGTFLKSNGEPKPVRD